MTTNIMALTYAPKIEAVKAGTIRQTIRMDRGNAKERKAGDILLMHTWAGKPYRSKWDWRMSVPIARVIKLNYQTKTWWKWESFKGLDTGDEDLEDGWYELEDYELQHYAEHDGIFPATRAELEATLMRLNSLGSLENTFWDVVRW